MKLLEYSSSLPIKDLGSYMSFELCLLFFKRLPSCIFYQTQWTKKQYEKTVGGPNAIHPTIDHLIIMVILLPTKKGHVGIYVVSFSLLVKGRRTRIQRHIHSCNYIFLVDWYMPSSLRLTVEFFFFIAAIFSTLNKDVDCSSHVLSFTVNKTWNIKLRLSSALIDKLFTNNRGLIQRLKFRKKTNEL